MLLARSLLAFLATVTVVAALFPTIRDRDDEVAIAIKKVHQTWKAGEEMAIDEEMWREHTPRHARSKRSVPYGKAAFAPPNSYCDVPGYTGEYCEFPICESTNFQIPQNRPPTGTGSTIDAAMLPRCDASMTTVLDADMFEIFITVESDGAANPKFTLFDAGGKISMPSRIEASTSDMYDVIFAPQKPGVYLVQLSADIPNVACHVHIRAETPLTIAGGFIPFSPSLSAERNDFPAVNPYMDQPSTFVVHANNLRSPGVLKTVAMFQESNLGTRPQTLSTRYACGYEFYLEAFYCRDDRASYYYRIEGIDFFGNKFRRIAAFKCLVAPPTASPSPTASTTSMPPPTSCANGGALINDPTGAYCYCTGMYTGRRCDKPVCMNGGTPTNSFGCACPVGFSGNHCQNVVCSDNADFGFITDRPTLIFVVRTTSALSSVINDIAAKIQTITNELQFDPEYLQHFALVTFVGGTPKVQSFTTGERLVNALQMAAQLAPNNLDCSDVVMTAVAEAMNSLLISNRSPIYLITDAIPNDEAQIETVFHLNSYYRAPIYVLFIQPDPTSGCLPDTFQLGYRTMVDIATRSAGQVFFVPNAQKTEVGNLFYTHMRHTFYRSSLLYLNDAIACGSQPTYQPISVDVKITELTVTATGSNLQLIISTPEGTEVPPTSSYRLNDTYFWRIAGPHIGQWMFTVMSQTPTSTCSYRMYNSQFKSQAPLEYDLFWGFTPQLNIDGPFLQPIFGMENGLVAHINNYQATDNTKVFAELAVYRHTRNGRENVFLSNGIWRNQCSYQLYFPPMRCENQNEMVYFTVFVRDNIGFMIQRSGVGYCVTVHPTYTPPNGCQNGGVPYTMPNNATACYCTPDWTGDKCQNRVCYNGGTPMQTGGGSWCQCPPGHAGQSCETVTCIQAGIGEPFSPIRRDMAFVIELTANSVLSVSRFAEYIPALLRDISLQHPWWIENFVLAGYNSTWSGILSIADRNNTGAFITAVNEALSSIQTNPDTSCKTRVWHALDETLRLLSKDSYVTVLHVSAPEETTLVPAIRAYNYVAQKRILMNVFYAYRATAAGGQMMCNATFRDYELLEQVSDVNGGRAYPVQQSDFYKILRMIPNYYSSGLVYVREFDDCSLKPQTVYFPVDSYTQTVQLNVRGYNNQIKIFNARGKEFTESYDLLDDLEHAAWRITEIRRPCDREWVEVGSQYCAKMEAMQRRSWSDASKYCHASGGFLVDELYADKDQWMNDNSYGTDFWIGLNDIGNTGTFVWDAPDGVTPPPFNASAYANWGPGEPANDPTKRCVARIHPDQNDKSKAYWYMRNCSEAYPLICEKHKYDQNAQPNSVTDDDLPAGKWMVQIQTTKPPANHMWNYTFCSVEVHVQSKLQVFPGFVIDEHADSPNSEATAGSDQNRFVSHLYGGDGARAAVLSYANLYNYYNLSMEASATYEQRRGCSYPWLSQTWKCPNSDDPKNKFLVMHTGEDQYGLNFQRMSTGRCGKPRSTCANGGIAYNGVCICSEFWMGATCTVPRCMNGGKLDTLTAQCKCPAGYAGHACQFDMCIPPVNATFTTDSKTFALVVELTTPNKVAVQKLADSIQSILTTATNANPTWFKSFLLVKIDSTKFITMVTSTSLNSFVTAVKALPSQITDSPTTCGAPLFGGLLSAMQSANLPSPGSVIFTVTRSIANDGNTNMGAFMDALTRTKAQLNYLVVDDSEKVCGFEADAKEVRALSVYAMSTGGNIFVLPTDSFTTFLTAYLPTLYTSTVLTTPTLVSTSCANQQWYIQVDARMTNVYINTFTTTAALTVVNPNGDIQPTTNVYQKGRTTLANFQTTNATGMYTIKMNGPTPCLVQVRGDSPVTVYTAFVQPANGDNGAHTDKTTSDPVAAVENVAVFHLAGMQRFIGRLTYTELINPFDGRIVVSQIHRRFNCSYEFYSKPFICPDQGFLVMVNGVDDRGQNFRREVAVAYCSNSTSSATTSSPSTPPVITTSTTPMPTTTTVSKWFPLKFDVVFLIDVSSTMPSADLVAVTKFIQTLMIPFNVAQEGARVGIFTVTGDNGFPLPISMLNSFSGHLALGSDLTSLNSSFYDGSSGQMLTIALNMMKGPDFLNQGYRDPSVTKNHLAIYITGTSTFSDGNAVAVAQQIRAANTFGFITVAYKATNADMNVLQNIAGGADCVFTANNENDLNTKVKSAIMDKIYIASTATYGIYCGHG